MSKSDISNISLEEKQRIMNEQLNQLERENERLVVQLKEVIKMNTHWQRYDSQREDYVLKLTRTNQELQNKVSDLQRQITELGKDLKTEIKKELEHPKLSEAVQSLRLDDEVHAKVASHLSSSSMRKEEEIAALTDHVAKLTDRISELESGRASRQKVDDEQVALLREQVNVCVEDFKQERKDRERCHDENQRLRDRLAQAENDLRANEEQLYVYQEQIKSLQERRRYRQEPTRRTYDEPCCYPNERSCHHGHQGHRPTAAIHRETIHRGRPRGAYYLGDDMTPLPSDVEVDGSPERSQDEADGVTTDVCDIADNGNEEIGENEALQCPKCLKSFGVQRHCELLDHIETCLEHEQ